MSEEDKDRTGWVAFLSNIMLLVICLGDMVGLFTLADSLFWLIFGAGMLTLTVAGWCWFTKKERGQS